MSVAAQPARPRSRVAAIVAACLVPVIAVAAVGFWAGTAARSRSEAPVLADANATGLQLSDRFFALLKAKDTAGLEAFLSPAFQLLRADGSANGKTDYIVNHLPTITDYTLDGLTATQDGAVLVARYRATVMGVTNGKPYSPGPAPRISTFVWSGGVWRLAGHANFDPLQGTAPLPAGTTYKLAFSVTSIADDSRLHTVGPDGAVQYGTTHLTGPAVLGSAPVAVELLMAMNYAQGTGPFDGFLTISAPNGDSLGFAYAGSATWDGTTSRMLGSVRSIGGTGMFAGVTGGGTVTGKRAGPVGSPVEHMLTLTLAGMPAE